MLAAFGGLLWAVIQLLGSVLSLLLTLAATAALLIYAYAAVHPDPSLNHRLIDRVQAATERLRR